MNQQLEIVETYMTEMTPVPRRVRFNLDIESLDVGPKSVVTQVGMLAVDMDDPDTILWAENIFLPMQPQINIERTISASTLIWWLTDSNVTQDARDLFKNNAGDDIEEIASQLRHIERKFNELTDYGKLEYEVWARGPQFDVVNVESLFGDFGMTPPWKYNMIRDLRTIMSAAKLSTKDVPRPEALTGHVGLADAKYQLLCLNRAELELRKV